MVIFPLFAFLYDEKVLNLQLISMDLDLVLTLDSIFKGLIIGVVASAPMGPVGVLIIQRTLNKGRWYGFVTGVGAAISDIIYALLTGFGMSFISFIVDDPSPTKKMVLQLAGSVMLFVFGLYTYKSKPQTNLPHKANKQKGSLFQNGLTGLLLTLSNPLIIFLFLALFARFSFVIPVGENGVHHPIEQTLGYLSIIAGALGWWIGITYTINKVRAKFNVNTIWMLNHVIGIVVMVVSLLSLFFTITGRTLY